MARINLLKPRQVETLPVGFHSDGSNLYLRVTGPNARAWVFRYMDRGKVKQIGLGATVERSVTEARELADRMRRALANGEDPAGVLTRRDADSMTFQLYAQELIAAKTPSFRNSKHAAQWPSTLYQYAYPVIGDKRIAAITLADIEAILRPIWSTKSETASRLRSRMEAVIDYGYVAEGVDRRNPAAFRGNLEHRGFGKARKITPVVHHAAAPYAVIPAIIDELCVLSSTTALCLRFTILTWARSSEARGARWSEVDDKLGLWSIPAERMKANKPHDVPLCQGARAVLAIMRKRRRPDSDLVFPGAAGGILSDVGLNKVLHSLPSVVCLDAQAMISTGNARAGRKSKRGATVHGMRSAARSWAAAQTEFAPFVAELALAHVNKDKVEAAYQRDRVLEKRRALLQAWSAFCLSPKILAFKRGGAD
ncbi:MAG TPA: integrase arm-type DNA-binding domain-containing protein [Hyphomonadaceae bacterium]|mgnify:CR=1 FL=1|nr:integrase arm-type DNA-binding domain-containing protein [Hyphomonadaceae bacterium]